MKPAVKFRRTYITAILTLILPLLLSLAEADVVISNVSPTDGGIHIEIYGNPPDPNGYVNLSFQLNDTTGGGDMEFYLDVKNETGGWENRLHLTDQSNGTWYHHEDEAPFNHTNRTCYWRINAKDHTTGVWTNQTFSFTTDRVPDAPSSPNPANGSCVEKGDIELSVVVTHPDSSAGAKIHNVTFYEYPSGRIIGWNYSSTGWVSGQTVKCNTTFNAFYEGTEYYWFAQAKDDEYRGENSSVYHIETNYTGTEPNIAYYPTGAEIYVNPPYTGTEPDVVYYSTGAGVNVVDLPQYHNMQPANASVGQRLSVELSADVNKTLTNATYWDFTFLTNNTQDGSWVAISTISQATVNHSLNPMSVWFSGLDWNTTYYWRISGYNATFDRYSNSLVYHFTTLQNESEPDAVYYSQGAEIYVNPPYTGTEPDVVYYSTGAGVNVVDLPQYHNMQPANASVGQRLSVELSADVNKTLTNATYWDFTFLTNNTQDGSWVAISTISQATVNHSLNPMSVWFSGLDWNTTYYWRISGYNATFDRYSNSLVYHFTTLQNESEPDAVYYSQGAEIYVQPEYTTPEPDIVYYSIGSEIPLNKPHSREPIPANNTDGGHTELNFSVLITSAGSSDVIDKVTFYWYPSNTVFGTVRNVNSGERATVHVSGLTNYTWYQWYVRVENGNWNITSDIWRYRPHNILPLVEETPKNNSIDVPVVQKLVGGEWKRFVRLSWNLAEPQGDDMGFKLYVDDPDVAGYQWTQRWTQLTGVTNGTYHHDEMWFNETGKTYHWKLEVIDGNPADSNPYNVTTYIFNFDAPYFLDWWWEPRYPTNDDTVHFYQISEHVDRVKWSFGDGTYSEVFNGSTHRYTLADLYNVSIVIYNDTNGVNYTDTICGRYGTGYLCCDRNVTLNTTGTGAGINYVLWHLPNETNLEGIRDNLSVGRGSWIHYYNNTLEAWQSLWVGYTGQNPDIYQYDTVVVTTPSNRTVRVNTTGNISYSQNRTMSPTYNYAGWTHETVNVTAMTSYGLQDGDWVHLYDTRSGTWQSRWLGHAGDKFDISPYDVVICAVGGNRSMVIP